MTAASWVRQPTTITGFGTALAALAAAAAHAVTADTTVVGLVGAAVFSLVHLLINDNTVATDAEKLAVDLLRAETAPTTPPAAG